MYSILNIAGLAAGMAVAMIIGLWIYDEVSANKHFKNYDTLYQVMMHQTFDGKRGSQTALPYPIRRRTENINFLTLKVWPCVIGASIIRWFMAKKR